MCIKDSILQIDSFWWLRTQMFVDKNLTGVFFDDDYNLLISNDLITYKYTISNNYKCNHFTLLASDKITTNKT